MCFFIFINVSIIFQEYQFSDFLIIKTFKRETTIRLMGDRLGARGPCPQIPLGGTEIRLR